MLPFQQARLWARRAPTPERVAAVVGAALLVTVVAWLLVPGTGTVTNVGAVVLAHEDAGQVDADYAAIRALERELVIEPVSAVGETVR